MGSRKVADATAQCAEIEDLLNILGVQASIFRVVKTGAVEQLIHQLRKAVSDRTAR